MVSTTLKNEAFETHVLEYDERYNKYSEVVKIELEAMRGVYYDESMNALK